MTMIPLRRLSLVEQTAHHVRDGIDKGQWTRHLPGVVELAKRFAVSKDTVRAAVQLLEKEGALKASGAGKRRTIVRKRPTRRQSLRVAILLEDDLPSNNAHSLELILAIKYAIDAAGHVCVIGEKSLKQMSGLLQVARFVRSTKADAWIVYGGRRDVLEWFARRKIPTLAIGGRCLGLPIAATYADVARAMAATVDALVTRGHRRIVLLCGTVWREPSPGRSAQTFLDSLQRHGIKVSGYNIPSWEETPEGFEAMMKSLFRVTPPTALFITEPSFCVAARIFLAERGLKVPGDVSLVSMLPDPAFSLHHPVIAHFEWTTPALVNRATQWVNAVTQGKGDHETIVFHAKFRPGGTIAAANS